MRFKYWIVSVCGGIFGLLNILTVATISAMAIDSPSPIDRIISGSWKQSLIIFGCPPALIGCGGFFLLLYMLGFLKISVAIGIAGGTLLGFLLGPPDFLLSDFGEIDAIIYILWEWIMGGIGGFVGNLIEKFSSPLD
ncbi:MAG: hypothetical protein ACEPOZ_20665 [Marinifilaceae bacterium]|jgi:hypothetical protein